MPCIYNRKVADRHCEYCSAVCDERPPKSYKIQTTSTIKLNDNMNYKEKIIEILTNKELTSEQKWQLETIFPELKESEDERIRKAILDYLTKMWGNSQDDVCGVHVEDAIAWLEKQGEKSSIRERYDRIKNSEWFKKTHEGMFVSEEEVDNANVVVPKDYSSIDPHFFKTTDKAEPRFKVGEWLCENEPNNYARFIQILEIVNVQGKKRYRISRNIHKDDEDVVEFEFVEKYYHKFDIQDVKNGDVLAVDPIDTYPSPFVAIYKKQNGEDFDSYCFIGFDGEFYKGENEHSTEEVYPATKKQRDFLFQKMQEVGYEWDADKKELRKIPYFGWDLIEADRRVESFWNKEDEKMVEDALQFAHEYGRHGLWCWLKSLKDRITNGKEN